LPAPWTPERALNFSLHFGKFKGSKIGDLIRSDDGQGYLRWMSENLSSNAATAATYALEHCTEAAR
jgi:hypothetical protein